MDEKLKFEELRRLLKGMDLPDHRKMQSTLDNVRWLRRNISKKNSEHNNIYEAIKLCDMILFNA